ncbi:MAG: DUF3427 domain-containing protein, partial [Proteobacteria bacterium]|nr:DUF3427 domain-containing protein [Pseudomonadota bacterium]
MTLADGLYDELLTEALQALVVGATQENGRTLRPLQVEDAPRRLADLLATQLVRILDDLEGDGEAKLRRQLELVNSILLSLRPRFGDRVDGIDGLGPFPQILQAIHRRRAVPEFPETGLSAPWLFTEGKGSPSLLSELRRELSACDQVDILVSFITYSGVRKLYDVLQTVTALGADGQVRTRLRVLTTTYIGATEIRALNELAGLPGCEIRISLDGR